MTFMWCLDATYISVNPTSCRNFADLALRYTDVCSFDSLAAREDRLSAGGREAEYARSKYSFVLADLVYQSLVISLRSPTSMIPTSMWMQNASVNPVI